MQRNQPWIDHKTSLDRCITFGLDAHRKYLQAITGSADEAHWMSQMQQAGVQIAPHIGASGERSKLLDKQQLLNGDQDLPRV